MTTGDEFYVITGGPGSGKSSLVDALYGAGFDTMPEAGRTIIRDQLDLGGNALPWADRAAFAELMFGWDLRSYREAARSKGPVVFDRGIPDVVGYLHLCDLPVPPRLFEAAKLHRYNRTVFVAPPWPEIFVQDAERKQTLADAEATYRTMVEVYSSLDYELVSLPRVSVEERVQFVRTHVQAVRRC